MAVPYWLRSPLNTKLTIALIGIIIISGLGMLFSTQYWMNRYHEESTQKLNASIAMYINDEYQLLSGGENEVNLEAIRQLSQQAMVINPMVEAYLLDTNGEVIAHSQQGNLERSRINLSPIKLFITGKTDLPIYAQDPKSLKKPTVFSATELRVDGQLQGYLYVVLGSSLYENVSALVSKSYSANMMIMCIALISLVALIMGALVFRMILSRLRSLTQQICSFTQEHSSKTVSCEQVHMQAHNSDEIRLLSETFEDMSDEIRRQLQLLKEADQTRRELISNVSHDLRTPLASIQGYLETLIIKDNKLTEEQRRYYLDTAMLSSKRLSDLVSELFELSKLESPTTSPSIETFSLTELIYDTMQEFELELHRKEIKWQLKSPMENVSVTADISLIQRVFENLIRNAVAYTPTHGSITLEIAPDTEQQFNPVKVRVIDSGAGIAEEDLPHIFNRFYANPDKSRKGSESNGLGLAIVKRILDLHESTISVESKLNQGTTFVFELPAAA